MKIIKYLLIVVNACYALIVLLFVLDIFETVELKGKAISSFIHYGTLLMTPVVVICNFVLFKARKMTLLLCLPAFMIVVCSFATIPERGMLAYFFSIESFQTQTIIYVNRHSTSKKIELQMQDQGAFGYNERTVEVNYLTSWLTTTKQVNENYNRGSQWIKINKEVNELNLNY